MGLAEFLIMSLLTIAISFAGFLIVDDAKRHHPRKRKTAHS